MNAVSRRLLSAPRQLRLRCCLPALRFGLLPAVWTFAGLAGFAGLAEASLLTEQTASVEAQWIRVEDARVHDPVQEGAAAEQLLAYCRDRYWPPRAAASLADERTREGSQEDAARLLALCACAAYASMSLYEGQFWQDLSSKLDDAQDEKAAYLEPGRQHEAKGLRLARLVERERDAARGIVTRVVLFELGPGLAPPVLAMKPPIADDSRKKRLLTRANAALVRLAESVGGGEAAMTTLTLPVGVFIVSAPSEAGEDVLTFPVKPDEPSVVSILVRRAADGGTIEHRTLALDPGIMSPDPWRDILRNLPYLAEPPKPPLRLARDITFWSGVGVAGLGTALLGLDIYYGNKFNNTTNVDSRRYYRDSGHAARNGWMACYSVGGGLMVTAGVLWILESVRAQESGGRP